MDIDFGGPILEAMFVKRNNRFIATIEYEGELDIAHVISTGRMRELLIPGNPVYIRKNNKPGRKTKYDLLAVPYQGIIVSIDSTLPNRLMAKMLAAGEVQPFAAFHKVRSEVAWGNSRLDFLLSNDQDNMFIEVKSVTLVEEGRGLFPDAPSERAVKHVHDLIDIKNQGQRAGVIFVIQRSDALCFSPNAKTDPRFAEALRFAVSEGVELYAYNCQVSREGVCLYRSIPIKL